MNKEVINMDIFDEMRRMQKEMDNLFRDFFRQPTDFLPSPTGKSRSLREDKSFRSPAVNVYEKGNQVVAEFELPGIDKKDIELNVTESSVEVKGKRRVEKEMKKKGYYLYESSSEGFYRKVPLPARVIPEKANAELKNGLLRVEMPKEEKQKEVKEKRIPVK